ncbi:hypothetical protein CISG_08082 [Coccidioides immitis RMSCC 3703]|uniref:AB hydrolase-1 domain-containing protein n=1 Tax=Coccidioides immitis RMSCC 3703 TaxID=454286 RepID=A0A0J8U0L8_COCIT|nr:hypothetical protein CISG_08082 [Coccidioides immitis RMSCC 3703]
MMLSLPTECLDQGWLCLPHQGSSAKVLLNEFGHGEVGQLTKPWNFYKCLTSIVDHIPGLLKTCFPTECLINLAPIDINIANTNDPMVKTYATPSPNVSKKEFVIGGILCAVHGLEELPVQCKHVSCLYVLHPRGNTMQSMKGIATSAVADWNERLKNGKVSTSQQDNGLIAVCFDQRNHGTREVDKLRNEAWRQGNPNHAQDMFSIFKNHGTREVDKLRNEAWRQGNPNHAQDMFSIFNGTARDVSQIMDFIGSYVFPDADRHITNSLVLGVSLGAHAAWHCLLHEPRIRAAVIVIGCPDYVSLMSDRARLSKLASWKDSSPPGSQFLGSKDFPQNLVDMVKIWDPAGLLFSQMDDSCLKEPIKPSTVREPTKAEQKALKTIMRRCLAGKKILNLSGGSDKLVPYSRGEPFLTWLKKAIASGGWFAEGRVSLEDIVFDGAGHEVTPAMITEAIRFIGETLATGDDEPETEAVFMSRI